MKVIIAELVEVYHMLDVPDEYEGVIDPEHIAETCTRNLRICKDGVEALQLCVNATNQAVNDSEAITLTPEGAGRRSIEFEVKDW